MVLTLALVMALMFGIPGLVSGVSAGHLLGRAGESRVAALGYGLLAGLACGLVGAMLIIESVTTSSSSTAGVGLIILPIPLLSNMMFGLVGCLVGHGVSR